MHTALAVGLCALLAGVPKAKLPALSSVTAGDYVEYEVSGSAGAKVVLRLQAAEVSKAEVVVDVRAVRGRPVRWLEGGARFRLAPGGQAPKEKAKARPNFDARPVSLQRGGAMFACQNYAWGSQKPEGTRGAGCEASPAKELALTGGLVDETVMSPEETYSVALVGVGHAEVPSPAPVEAFRAGSSWTTREALGVTVRREVSSAGGKVVTTSTGVPATGGKGKTTETSQTLLEVLRVLLSTLPDAAPEGLPGPEVTAGPRPLETVLVERPARGKSPARVETRAARPGEVPEAPLPVRFGALVVEEKGEKPKVLQQVTEWR
ncbi:MAG: hypothetical protein IT380_19565 [Myxococcales bacterium]|nr:hypothetical protein [Myxococcales bacterium]